MGNKTKCQKEIRTNKDKLLGGNSTKTNECIQEVFGNQEEITDEVQHLNPTMRALMRSTMCSSTSFLSHWFTIICQLDKYKTLKLFTSKTPTHLPLASFWPEACKYHLLWQQHQTWSYNKLYAGGIEELGVCIM